MLFAFGASDPAQLSEAAIDLAAPLADFDLRLVVGPLVPSGRRAALRDRARHRALELREAPATIADCFAGVSVAVVPYGQTLLEALLFRAAVAMWHPSPEHAEVGRRFSTACGAWPLLEVGWGPSAVHRVEAAVRALAQHPLPNASPVDSQGAVRIAQALEQSAAARPRAARPALVCSTETT